MLGSHRGEVAISIFEARIELATSGAELLGAFARDEELSEIYQSKYDNRHWMRGSARSLQESSQLMAWRATTPACSDR
jgi:hypothetical protein